MILWCALGLQQTNYGLGEATSNMLWPQWRRSDFTLDFHEFHEWTNTTSWSYVAWDKCNDTLRLTWLDTKNKHHKNRHLTSPQILRNLMALRENKQILFNKSRANIRNGCTDFSSSNIYHPNPTELKATCLSHSPSITSIWKVCGCNACSLNCFGSRGVKPIHRYFCWGTNMIQPMEGWNIIKTSDLGKRIVS